MARRVVVYERKSSKDRDEKQKHSIERQDRDIEAFIERYNHIERDPAKKLAWQKQKDVDWFFEDASAKVPASGLLGARAERPKFLKMIERIRENRFDVLVCTELSRLSRNATDNGSVVQLLDAYDKQGNTHLSEIRTLDAAFDATPTGKFNLGMFLLVAKYENDQRAANTKSGMKYKRAKGGTSGKAPLGYRNCGTEKGDKWVETDEPNFSICRELWEMLLTGDYTFEALFRHAEQRNLRHFWNNEDRPVSDVTIRKMFTSRYYCGQIRDGYDENGDEAWSPGVHPPMVSDEEFWDAQKILQKIGYKHQKLPKAFCTGRLIGSIMVSGQHSFNNAQGAVVPTPVVFERRVRLTCGKCRHRFYDTTKRCAKCDSPVDERTSRSAIERFYHGKKIRKSVALAKVIGWLEAELSRLYISDALFEILKKQLYTLWLKENARYSRTTKRLDEKLTRLKKQRGELTCKKALAEHDERREDLFIAIESIEEKIRATEDEIRQQRQAHTDRFEIAWQRLQTLRDAKSILTEDMRFEPAKSLLLSLCSNLKMFDDHLEIEWHEPFDQLVKAMPDKTEKSGRTPGSPTLSTCGSPEEKIVRTLVEMRNPGYLTPATVEGHTRWKESAVIIRRRMRAPAKATQAGIEPI